jgi:CO/xanthine dehydrogenase Mo-binding subunit
LDAFDKVTGRAVYAADLSVPGMAHAACVHSTVAHARIEKIEVAGALQHEDVIAVITGADLQALDIFPWFGGVIADRPILAIEKVRFVGEPVAMVIAESEAAARLGAEKVIVFYEELPAVITPEEALTPGAPLIHAPIPGSKEDPVTSPEERSDGPTNLGFVHRHGWGDVGSAMKEASVVVSGVFEYPMLYGYSMETYNSMARHEQSTLTVWTTTHTPFLIRNELARVFKMPLAKVRVVVPYVGASYGTKAFAKTEPLSAAAALITGRTVKIRLNVTESIQTGRSDTMTIRATSGFRPDGRLAARTFEILVPAGAYADLSPEVTAKAAARCAGPYRVPALDVRTRVVFTNTVPGAAFRGFGGPAAVFAGESLMDMAAEKFGLAPHEIRLINLANRGEVFWPGKRALDSDIKEDLRLLVQELDQSPVENPGASHVRKGRGLAIAATNPGDSSPVATALIRVHADGTCSLLTAAVEVGQGSRTVLAQIAAQELGLALDQVAIFQSDTGVGAYDKFTAASSTTTLTGLAVQRAAGHAREQIRKLAAEVLEVEPDSVVDTAAGVLVDGEFHPYGEIISSWFRAPAGEVVGYGVVRGDGVLGAEPAFWEVGVIGVEVSVDTQTGLIKVEKLISIGDCGFAINPSLVEGQELGAAFMGLGGALREHLQYEGSEIINASIADYHIGRLSDWPKVMTSILAERADGVGPYGARGAGEGSIQPVGAAVASAVASAIGVRFERLPITPEQVLIAIEGSS